jgi:hypothetical protein
MVGKSNVEDLWLKNIFFNIFSLKIPIKYYKILINHLSTPKLLKK